MPCFIINLNNKFLNLALDFFVRIFILLLIHSRITIYKSKNKEH